MAHTSTRLHFFLMNHKCKNAIFVSPVELECRTKGHCSRILPDGLVCMQFHSYEANQWFALGSKGYTPLVVAKNKLKYVLLKKIVALSSRLCGYSPVELSISWTLTKNPMFLSQEGEVLTVKSRAWRSISNYISDVNDALSIFALFLKNVEIRPGGALYLSAHDHIHFTITLDKGEWIILFCRKKRDTAASSSVILSHTSLAWDTRGDNPSKQEFLMDTKCGDAVVVRRLSPSKRRRVKNPSKMVNGVDDVSQRGGDHSLRHERVPFRPIVSDFRQRREECDNEFTIPTHSIRLSSLPPPVAAPSPQLQEILHSERSEGLSARQWRDNDFDTRKKAEGVGGVRVVVDSKPTTRFTEERMKKTDFFNVPIASVYSWRPQISSTLSPFGHLALPYSHASIAETGRVRDLQMALTTPVTTSLLSPDHYLCFGQWNNFSSATTKSHNYKEVDPSSLSPWLLDKQRFDDDLAFSMRSDVLQSSVGQQRRDQMHYLDCRFGHASMAPSLSVQHQNAGILSKRTTDTAYRYQNGQDDLAGWVASSSRLTESQLCVQSTAARSLARSLNSSTATGIVTSSLLATGVRASTTSSGDFRSTSPTPALLPHHIPYSAKPTGVVGHVSQRSPTCYPRIDRCTVKSKSRHGSRISLPVREGLYPRICIRLATDEDQNWLSEFLCFVRSDLIEIFRANEEDVCARKRSKKVVYGQVGIRCRYCAHLPPSARANRSSSYPFTLSRIYQSLTMMLRDHFGSCSSIPLPIKQRFLSLKGKTPQGATGSNNFWEYSAKKLGLVDSEFGIWVNEEGDFTNDCIYGGTKPVRPVGVSNKARASSSGGDFQLVIPDDRALVPDFLYVLMTHALLVHMEESERIGNRKSLQVGLAGIGCRYCCLSYRKGLCRLFPARRRTLPGKVYDFYEHVRRCTLCPKECKESLAFLKNLDDGHKNEAMRMVGEKEFFDRVWARMGYSGSDAES